MYNKEVNQPVKANITMMREENVKFNKSTSMRADCAILILNASMDEDGVKNELKRFQHVITDGCKKDIFAVVISNEKQDEPNNTRVSDEIRTTFCQSIDLKVKKFFNLDLSDSMIVDEATSWIIQEVHNWKQLMDESGVNSSIKLVAGRHSSTSKNRISNNIAGKSENLVLNHDM